MRVAFVLFILLIFTLSCKKEAIPNINCSTKTNDLENVRQLLPGSYHWVYTKAHMMGNPPYIESAASAGLDYQYVFKKNGTVDYYESNVLISSDNYLIDYEFKVTTYPLDSAIIIIINDKQTGQRKDFFQPWLCADSALFYSPHNSIEIQRYFKRN
jgi:hypothetical protein